MQTTLLAFFSDAIVANPLCKSTIFSGAAGTLLANSSGYICRSRATRGIGDRNRNIKLSSQSDGTYARFCRDIWGKCSSPNRSRIQVNRTLVTLVTDNPLPSNSEKMRYLRRARILPSRSQYNTPSCTRSSTRSIVGGKNTIIGPRDKWI